jgi:hypothetical protein
MNQLKQLSNGSKQNGLTRSDLLSFIKCNKILIITGLTLFSTLLIFIVATGMRRDTFHLELYFLIPFTIYGIAIWRISRDRLFNKKNGMSEKKRRGYYKRLLLLILLFSILFRAIFFFSSPILSDDVYRYYWEGKMIANGNDPYQLAPDSEELEEYRDTEWESVNNKDIPSIYPPFSQLVHTITYSIYPDIMTFKLIFLLFDILCIYIIFMILKNFKIDPRYSIIYAWCPLVIIEFAHSGHNDSLAIFLVLLSFWSQQKNMRTISAIALALGVLTKIFPLLFAPLLFRSWGYKNTAIFLGILGLFYLPFINAGSSLFTGASIYADEWLFNGSIFPLLVEFTEIFHTVNDPILTAKIVIVVLFSIGFLYALYKTWEDKEDPKQLMKYSLILIGLYLILTPTFHPWYIIWLIPFLCIFWYRSWILLSGTLIFSYYIYIDFDTLGVWHESWWIKLIEYLPFYIVFIYEFQIIQKTYQKLQSIFSNKKTI